MNQRHSLIPCRADPCLLAPLGAFFKSSRGLINGAQARNVFWQVGSTARIEDGNEIVGTLIVP